MGVGGGFSAELEGIVAKKARNLLKGKMLGRKQSE